MKDALEIIGILLSAFALYMLAMFVLGTGWALFFALLNWKVHTDIIMGLAALSGLGICIAIAYYND